MVRSAAQIAAAVADVQQRIAHAHAQHGQKRPVTLIAVSKRQPFAAVEAAYAAGIRDFGENVAQDLRTKAALAQQAGLRLRWHFLGRLQRNKVRLVVEHAAITHSVDSPKLVGALATAQQRWQPQGTHGVFVQVNCSAEPQKGGVDPVDVLGLCAYVQQHAELTLLGLMTVPRMGSDPAPTFMQLAHLARQVQCRHQTALALQLSMGMSCDFEHAIACGASQVRVGQSIFGERPQ